VELSLGQLVSSKAGRDQGKYYLIVAIINDNYVAVADGNLRTSANPKRKNIKHLNIHRPVAALIKEKLSKGQEPSNAEIMAALRELVPAGDRQGMNDEGGLA